MSALAELDIAAVLDVGAAAYSVCFRRLVGHNRILQREGFRPVSTYPTSARFKFGDGRLGEIRQAADIPAGIAGNAGKITAFVLEAIIPALLRKGALEAPGDIPTLRIQGDIATSRIQGDISGDIPHTGACIQVPAGITLRYCDYCAYRCLQLDISGDIPPLRIQGVDIPARVARMGHCILSVVDFGRGRPRSRKRPTFSASHSDWASANKRPDVSDCGLRLPKKEAGLHRFEPLHNHSACKAATPRGATD